MKTVTCGLLYAAYVAITAVLYLTNPLLFLHNPGTIAFAIFVYDSGAISYFSFKWYRRRKQGIDITLAYKEVPLE